jgi:hypothetical protein
MCCGSSARWYKDFCFSGAVAFILEVRHVRQEILLGGCAVDKTLGTRVLVGFCYMVYSAVG